MVIFEGVTRNPVPIFNEKAVLKLGRGLSTTGRLNEEGVLGAVEVMQRFYAIARSMDAAPFEILATAAVRDARNGAEFVASLREHMPNVPVRVLSGEEEASFAAAGVVCGIPDADGLVADIGGGSLELIRMVNGERHEACSLPLGVIRLNDRANGDVTAARDIADRDIASVPWLDQLVGKPLYLVGGAFRALARLQIARTHYPLNIVHLYEMGEGEAREMADWLIATPRRTLERLAHAPKKRLPDVPFAATVLRRLMRQVQPGRIVFSVDGLREGWYMREVAEAIAGRDPNEALAEEISARLSRSTALPRDLVAWTTPLFSNETPKVAALRRMACFMSDIGAFDHPEYRAEQTYLRTLRVHGSGFDHPSRAFVALTLAVRYEADVTAPLFEPSRRLIDREAHGLAVRLGLALRLAYTLCGGTPALLAGSSLKIKGKELVLSLSSDTARVSGGSVRRRLERLAAVMDLSAVMREL
ncbi:Ppx/GppA family phosphatase [Tanticharoenia sakaeratensis]|uniref:Ppx/GppA phosphatase n=1 Tax=Tanticharoenia sakaeratensis NBRC 103193 TaxID=1231623 RepID=A0A0D6MKR9_9PROT|nr:Ppx/GppA family phosphatase [Tanticharoenia sakaeratensis]GAN53863.1 Ppx/GppA phosphatase [Tanticharoenia sakaeratensis NBRC 103193]GBQ25112.1 exopolyphosphatase [Tanticharoenia sakaeratensis NBRC 103193]